MSDNPPHMGWIFLLYKLFINEIKVAIFMGKKVIINESDLLKIASMQILEESGSLTKSDIYDAVKDAIKNDSQINKEFEKKVKNLVAACVNMLFKTLWQRRNFYEDEIKK